MPSIFSRRRGSSQPPAMRNTTTSPAAAAASQAYLQKNNSSSALSSAAAAAALRSLTSSPEPVGSIQTKRMIRRGSMTSNGGGSLTSAVRQPSLTRRDSQGSMSERTFRSPSPGRTNSLRLSAASSAPPVPAIPRSLSMRHQRANSLEAPNRTMSPQNSTVDRTMSMDRKTMPSSLRMPKASRLSNVSELEERSERQDARNSVNFSRPIQSPPASPTTAQPEGKSRYTHGAGGWFSGATGAVASSSSKATSRPVATNAIEANSGKKLVPVDTTQSLAEQTPSVQFETYMAFDANTRTFVPRQRVVQKPAEPPSPQLPAPKPLAPGSWDPHTRSIVPAPASISTPAAATSSQVAQPAAPAQQYIAPPPRNPKRLSMESLPQSPFLKKDAESSPRDDQDNEVVLQDTGQTVETSVGPANLLVSSTHQRNDSLNVPRQSIETSEVRRQTSVSPHRTRFSPSPVLESVRHNPPPRSMSPVKSAMKPSPASSLRTTSPLPVAAVASKVPPSDASDAGSLASHEGTPKPKKSVRVSFDERAQEIAIPDLSATERAAALDDDDLDSETMAPRPALPSFGSVRNQRVAPGGSNSTAQPSVERQESSSDHALGGIISASIESTRSAQGEQNSKAMESTTISATTNVKDLSNSDAPVEHSALESGKGIQSHDFAQDGTQATDNDQNLPNINLLPPTPGTDEENRKLGETTELGTATNPNRNSMEGIVVPGGWSTAEKAKNVTSTADAQNVAPSTVSFEEPLDSRHLGTLDAITEDTDDEFSDAAEDLTDVDEGGFASLNAIANSPVVIPKDSGREDVSVPDSPIADRTSKSIEPSQLAGETSVKDWRATTNYWSKLSQTQREQMERDRLPLDDETTPTKATNNENATPATSQPATVSSATSDEPRTMRRSLRTSPEPVLASAPTATEGEVRMRRSMREKVNGTALSSRPKSPTQSSTAVALEPSLGPKPAPVTRPAMRATGSGSFSSKLEQKYTNDSDSESSFRKKKRASSSTVDAQGKYTMKRSMRAATNGPSPADNYRPVSPEVQRKGDRTLSVRSLSPSGSFFSGRAKSERLRESLRGAPESGTKRNTLRANASTARPASFAGTSRSKFRSRFADSDDSDDGGPNTGRGFFRSRFADSDDDEPSSPGLIRADLTPVRGIPKSVGRHDGDSTDLEEEAEEDSRKWSRKRNKQKTPLVPNPADVEKAMEAARRNLGIASPTEPQPSREGHSLQKGTLRRDSMASDAPVQTPTRFGSVEPVEEKKKRGFMGILRRNRSSTQSVPQIDTGAMDDAPPVPPLPSGVQPAPIINSGSPKSKTRPTRRLQRGDSGLSTATAPAYVSGANNDASDNWPLPPTNGVINGASFHDGDRPNTSDGGASHAGRGGKAVRIAGLDPDDSGVKPSRDVYSMRTGRKKRFGMLRRAFGLND